MGLQDHRCSQNRHRHKLRWRMIRLGEEMVSKRSDRGEESMVCVHRWSGGKVIVSDDGHEDRDFYLSSGNAGPVHGGLWREGDDGRSDGHRIDDCQIDIDLDLYGGRRCGSNYEDSVCRGGSWNDGTSRHVFGVQEGC